MKYLEFFAIKCIANIFIVNLIMLVGLPLFGIHFGMNLLVNVIIPVVFAGAAVEREMNREKQMLLFSSAF
ncbi:MAG: hypothetical protein IJG40_16040 [Oscillospiraceae bacterium]|nr:hypothetical protein [Oscillospiraceae bacterium]